MHPTRGPRPDPCHPNDAPGEIEDTRQVAGFSPREASKASEASLVRYLAPHRAPWFRYGIRLQSGAEATSRGHSSVRFRESQADPYAGGPSPTVRWAAQNRCDEGEE